MPSITRSRWVFGPNASRFVAVTAQNQPNPGNWNSTYHYQTGAGPFYDTVTGINNPGWRQQIKDGQNATTPRTGTKYVVTIPDSFWSFRAEFDPLGPHGLTTWSSVGPQGNIGFTWNQTIQPPENEALITLYKRIRENHTKFSSMTFLGELRQAISMIKRPANTLRKGLDSYIGTLKQRSKGISKTSKRGKLARKKILADTWLEYSFGWTPLISDVGNAAKALAAWNVGRDGYDERRNVISSSASATEFGLNQSLTGVLGMGTNDNFPFRKIDQGSYTSMVRYKVGLTYKTAVPVGSAARLAELSGFSLREFVPTAWELLPWSFLIDYFSNVGDVLEAFATPTDNISWICRTYRNTKVQSCTYRFIPDAFVGIPEYSWQESSNGTSSWILQETSFSREAVSSLSLPRLSLENPFGRNAFRRSLNLIGLAAGAKSLKPYY
jgi:hypothetical protein